MCGREIEAWGSARFSQLAHSTTNVFSGRLNSVPELRITLPPWCAPHSTSLRLCASSCTEILRSWAPPWLELWFLLSFLLFFFALFFPYLPGCVNSCDFYTLIYGLLRPSCLRLWRWVFVVWGLVKFSGRFFMLSFFFNCLCHWLTLVWKCMLKNRAVYIIYQ